MVKGKEKAENLNISTGNYADNKILFVNFLVELVDSVKGDYKFTLSSSTLADGTLLKNAFLEKNTYEPYQLYCELSDEEHQQVEMIKMQDPLLKVFEYSPDKKNLEKKLIPSKTGELHLRFQYTKKTKYLTIYKPNPDLRTLKIIYHAQI